MTEIISDQRLKFPFDFEYSIDDGTTWINGTANELTIVPSDQLDESIGYKIKVRSSSPDATTLVGSDIGVTDRSFGEINIKNASGIVDFGGFFRFGTVDRIIVQNFSEAEHVNVTEICDSTVSKYIHFDEIPRIQSASYMFSNSVGGIVDPLVLGRLTVPDIASERNSAISYMFYRSNFDMVCGVENSNSTHYDGNPSVGNGIFRESEIYSIGHVEDSTYGNEAARYIGLNGLFKSNLSRQLKHAPSVDFYTKNSRTDAQYASKYFLYSSSGYEPKYTYLPSMKFKFGSLSAKNLDIYQSGRLVYFHSSYPPLATPKFGGINYMLSPLDDASNSVFYSTYTSGSCVFSKLLFRGETANNSVGHAWCGSEPAGVLKFKDDPEWFPNVSFTYTNMNTELIGADGVYPRNLKYNKFSIGGQDTVVETGYGYKPAEDEAYGEETIIINDVSNIVGCNNGVTAKQVGSDIIIYDSDDEARTAIAGKTLEKSIFNATGTRLYILEATSLDRNGNTGQQTTATLNVYNAINGQLLSASSIPVNQDEEVVAVYQKDDNSFVRVVYVVYFADPENENAYTFKETVVRAYADTSFDGIVAGEDAIDDIEPNGAFLSNFETNEFNVFDSITGKVNTIVGK